VTLRLRASSSGSRRARRSRYRPSCCKARGRWCWHRHAHGHAGPLLHRPLPTADDPAHRPRRAAGGPAGDRRRRDRAPAWRPVRLAGLRVPAHRTLSRNIEKRCGFTGIFPPALCLAFALTAGLKRRASSSMPHAQIPQAVPEESHVSKIPP
jgi:hypothetical protein